jgi:hypothetical protein
MLRPVEMNVTVRSGGPPTMHGTVATGIVAHAAVRNLSFATGPVRATFWRTTRLTWQLRDELVPQIASGDGSKYT